MKRGLLLIVIVGFLVCSVQAETKGDINDDGQLGLPEAIYALQVTAGINNLPPSNTEYDILDYFNPTIGDVYSFLLNGGEATGTLSYPVTEMVNGIETIREVRSGNSPGTYTFENIKLEDEGWVRYKDNEVENGNIVEYAYLTPSPLMFPRFFRVGETFTSHHLRTEYEPPSAIIIPADGTSPSALTPNSDYFDEVSILSETVKFEKVEDIKILDSVEIKDCVKILTSVGAVAQTAGDSQSRNVITWIAPGVGIVKQIRIHCEFDPDTKSTECNTYVSERLGLAAPTE